jgi:hypothetical protein
MPRGDFYPLSASTSFRQGSLIPYNINYIADAIFRFQAGVDRVQRTPVVLYPIMTSFFFRGTPSEPPGWDRTELSFLMVAGRSDQRM